MSTTTTMQWVKASEKPMPKKYTGKILITLGGGKPEEGIMWRGCYYNRLAGRFHPKPFFGEGTEVEYLEEKEVTVTTDAETLIQTICAETYESEYDAESYLLSIRTLCEDYLSKKQ